MVMQKGNILHALRERGVGLMYLGRMNKPRYQWIVLFICSILLLYLIFTPLLYNQQGKLITYSHAKTKGISWNNSLNQDGRYYITAAVTENVMTADAVIYHIMSRNQQESRQIANLMYYALAVLLSGYGILVHSSRCFRRRAKRQDCVLASSMGGHAPPAGYYNFAQIL